MDTLDVTQIEPRLKHPSIFKKFDEMDEGASFIIHNDHDPKPLYYQLIAERGEVFDWKYLEEGPQIWEIQITKLNLGEKPTTIGELVSEDYRKAEVFGKFGLDFCCDGKKSLKEACDKQGVNENEVRNELDKLENRTKNTQNDFNSWDLDFLADYIINIHHKYVKNSVTMLFEYSDKVANRHGNNHPEVIKIAQLFGEIADDFKSHMYKEETILFPYIKKLAIAKRENNNIETAAFGSVGNPINMMMTEHENVGNLWMKYIL